jgi:hypothetical protein
MSSQGPTKIYLFMISIPHLTNVDLKANVDGVRARKEEPHQNNNWRISEMDRIKNKRRNDATEIA